MLVASLVGSLIELGITTDVKLASVVADVITLVVASGGADGITLVVASGGADDVDIR